MKKKEYKLGGNGRDAVKNVAQQVNDVLGKTLGPAGRNYYLPTGITNDGITIMSHLRFEDPCEDQASLAFHEVARQTDKDAGDGTTTSMVLAAQLTLDILDKVADIDTPAPNEIPVMELSRQLDEEKDKALKLLEKAVLPIKTIEELEKVAMTSMENEEGAKIIAETMWQAGKDSYPVLKEGFNEKIEKDVVGGVEFPLNIASTTMFNQVGRAEYENPVVLVAHHCFEQYSELSPFMLSMLNQKTPRTALIIVAKQFSIPFVNAVSEATKRSNFPIVLVSANFHNDTFEDIAAYVDAKLIDTHPKGGRKITEAKIQDAGEVKSILVREKSTQFLGGRGLDALKMGEEGLISRVQERVNEINELRQTEKDAEERKQMERRSAALLGGIATIYVDAKTAAERYYLKLKAEDAMNSCRDALNGGMVKGGGLTLKEIASELGEDSLLYNALNAPYRRILQNNMGQELDTTDVFDAYAVARASIENSVSVVKVLLTIEGIIAEPEVSLVEELKEKLFT